MRIISLLFVFVLAVTVFHSCETEPVETPSTLQGVKLTKYFDAEVFAAPDLKIYGKWEIFAISGGFAGTGYEPDFEFLEIKEFGIYGFAINDSLLEYGKVSPAGDPLMNSVGLKVSFEKDESSGLFFTDPIKYVVFSGADTMHLNSSCCDRYNYHFKRVE